MHKVVVGIFSNADSAARAVHEFRSRGFSPQDLSVIPATDDTLIEDPVVAHVAVMPSTARGLGLFPIAGAIIGAILGFLFWQVVPASYGHLVAIGGLLGFLQGAAVGVVLETLLRPALSRYRRSRAALHNEQPARRTLVAVHTEELLETYEAERLLEISGATEISTKAA